MIRLERSRQYQVPPEAAFTYITDPATGTSTGRTSSPSPSRIARSGASRATRCDYGCGWQVGRPSSP